MSSFRLRFSWGSERLIVPVPSNLVKEGSVKDLLALATTRFRQHSAQSFDADNSFVQLLTSDGFGFASSDPISAVIKDDDSLTVLDSASWIEQHTKFISGGLLADASAVDFEDDVRRWAHVGWSTKLSKLYCSVGKTYKTTNKLVFFSIEDLSSFPKSQTVAEISGPEWFCKVVFAVDNGRVNAVELHIKTKADQRALIKQMSLVYGDNVIKAGNIVILQEAFTRSNKVYSIPSPKEEGPKILECLPYDAKLPDVACPENKSSGACPVELKQREGRGFYEQSWNSKNDGCQNISMEFDMKNNSTNQTVITLFSSEYLNGEGKWVPTSSTAWGHKSSPYYYPCQNPGEDTLLELAGGQIDRIALRARIDISGPSLENRARRIYSTLPSPLKIRFSWTDSDSRKSSIEISCVNSPPQFRTKEELEKNRSLPVIFMATCDDTVCEERIALTAYLNETEQRVELENKLKSSNMYLHAQDIRKYAYNAAKEGKSEIDLDLTYDSDGFKASYSLLVDVAEKHGYAVKAHLKTTTSSNTSYFLLPTLRST